jgi:hypothetical protein
MWATTPTNCYSSSGSTCQRLVVVVGLLLILVFAAALTSDICFRLAVLPCLWSRLRMSCTPYYSPGVLVHQAKKLRDVLHIVHGELLEQLLISHALSKSNNRSIGDAGDSVLNLGEPLDEGPQ